MSDTISNLANEIIQIQTQLAADRGNFEDQWQRVADRVDPKSSTAFFAAGDRRIFKKAEPTQGTV